MKKPWPPYLRKFFAILVAMAALLFAQNEARAAVAYGAAGAVAIGSTSLSVPHPAGIVAGNLLVLVVGNKFSPDNPPATPVGWTLVWQGAGGLGPTNANDQGPVFSTIFVKEAVGGETGNLAVTLPGGNSSMGRMFRYTKAAGTSWNYAATSGSDDTVDTAWSVTGAANPGITTGDMLIVGSAVNTDGYTFSAESVSAAGATLGTHLERQDSGTTTGRDLRLVVSDHTVTAGTATAAPVFTMTASGTALNRPTGASVILRIREVILSTTTLATGTDPLTTTIAPGDPATDVDIFTLQTSSGTEAITSVTVNLSTNSGVGRLAITDNAGGEYGFTTSPVAGANTITVTGMSATTTLTTFKVRVTPLGHALPMPAPPGAAYAITAPVTAWAGPNTHAGSDTNPNALTIDNLSPDGATSTGGTAGDSQVTLNWTTSASADLSRSVMLRWTGGAAGVEVPAEGTDYVVDGAIGTATVACVRTADAASTAVSGVDGTGVGGCSATALTSGQAYTYKIFQKDTNGNYDTGAAVGAFTPTGLGGNVINTYYPGTASVLAGATSITLGAATGAITPIAIGDLLLIMQMQDATIDSTNTASYGTVSAANAGLYEYAIAASAVPLGGGTLSLLPCGIINAYTNANYVAGSSGQRRFQVIRVPVQANATLNSTLTALAWNGSTGGVLAFDVTGALNLNSATVTVDGKGFRGGAVRTLTGGVGANTDYRTLATVSNNGSKGEGIAGTPYYLFTAPGALTNTGVEGYPNGSHARGAPANGGGGGTDRNPVANDQNPGGGGGANAGAGGLGGIGWCPTFSAVTPPLYGCGPNSGGLGGNPVTGLGATRLPLGGGGGGATTNNGTGTPAAGLASSGAAGGGSIMIRADSFTGSATFNANGSAANNTVGNDGSGGGGAGGTVMLLANSGMAGATINVNGGMGGTNLIPPLSSGPHGPGGGGGGGYAITSAATAACNNGGGINGVTYNNGALFGAYGSTPGSAGSCVTSLTAAQIPGTSLGAVSCSGHDHYAISYPLGNPGVTCEALAVRVTGHKIDHTDAVPSMGTQITLSTSPAADGWALRSGGGAFTAPNKYTFDGTETYAEFWLTETTPTTAPHIDIDVTDGSRTDIDGDTTEDVKAGFTDTAFKYYDCTGAVPGTCSEVSINNQIAGKPSSTAPNAQSLYLRAVKKNTTTSTCTGGLAGVQVVQFAYECNNPATCYGSNMLTINASGNSITIPRNDNTNVSISTGSYSAATGACPSTSVVCMNFTADGFAPFNLNYSDAGQVTLHARKTVTAGVGDPPSTAATIYGASNAFVRPFAFELTVPGNPKATAYNGTVFKAAGDNFDATVRGVVWQAADDDPSGTPAYDGLPNAGADLSDNAVTPSYAWTTDLLADATAGSYTPLPADGGVLGALAPSLATISQASFSNGSATYTPLTWSEVGSFTLKADATDYLGVSGLNMRGSVVVGRFYPHHFGISGTVRTRSDRPAGSGFTYMDEPMELTLTVKAYRYVASHSVNPDDDITLNYVGSFAKLDATTLCSGDVATCATGANGINWFNTGCTVGTQCMGLGAKDGSTGLSGRLGIVGAGTYASVGNPSSSWSAGVGTFTANVKVARNATLDGPYDTLKFGGMPMDSDGVTLPGQASSDTHKVDLDATTMDTLASNPDGTTNERREIFQTIVRFGRLRLLNTYGSELLDSRVEVRAEYWDGSRWTTNTPDNLTTLAFGNVYPSNPVGISSPLVKTITQFASGPGGVGFITFDTAGVGSFDIALNLNASGSDTSCNNAGHGGTVASMPYLQGFWAAVLNCNNVAAFAQDPNARIKLGSPKAPYIYIRERY